MADLYPHLPTRWRGFFLIMVLGTFTESVAFTDMKLRGLHGETILVADFNNDGCLDIFWPQCTACGPNEQNYLLIMTARVISPKSPMRQVLP